jgi:hypothetical protein
MSRYSVDPGTGPRLSMNGFEEKDLAHDAPCKCDTAVFMTWRTTAGLRKIAGRR